MLVHTMLILINYPGLQRDGMLSCEPRVNGQCFVVTMLPHSVLDVLTTNSTVGLDLTYFVFVYTNRSGNTPCSPVAAMKQP